MKEILCGDCRSYDLCSIDQVSSQLGIKCALTVFTQWTLKLDQIILWEIDSGERWKAIMALLLMNTVMNHDMLLLYQYFIA